jgi:putative ABC transport system permease protein
MGRLSWAQLRFRTARSLALLLGMLLATTAFTVLTAASRTSQLRAIGAVTAHFRTAYDILVRPAGARTALENQTGTVQPNFLSGIYGGISIRQYRKIAAMPGVQVAAPIAMIGYTFPNGASIGVPLPRAAVASRRRELFRITTTWISDGGSSRVTGPPSYSYLTPGRLGFVNSNADSTEVAPDGRRVVVCHSSLGRASSPFGPAAQSAAACYSRINGAGIPGMAGGETYTDPESYVDWTFPLLIAAIDPRAEARLDGLNHAITSGRYLSENPAPGTISSAGAPITTIPVLAAASSGIGEYAVTRVQELASPAGPPDLDLAGVRREATVPGRTVQTFRTTPQQAYRQLLAAMSPKSRVYPGVGGYWSVGPTSYRRAADGSLTPVLVHNLASVWRSGGSAGILPAPMDNADNQYRVLHGHQVSGQLPGEVITESLAPRLAGIFSPARIEAFDPLTRVPLGGYEPTVAAPADAASRRALGGHDLLPNQNLGGYVSQPVQLVTTLSSLPALENSNFSGNIDTAAPISVIRVRVTGVTGANAVSRARVQQVAQEIAVGTGLDTDIVAGSSLVPVRISLPAGRFGQPALQLTEDWVKKGVVLAILTAVDRKSVLLFTLILLVCALFVANSATAAVRGRRRELGVLACLGWTRPRLFATVLGELAAIGLAAGLAGGLISLPLASALGLHVSAARAALAVPVAMALAVAAGAVPAWLGCRADPAASVRPPVLAVRRGRQVRGITGLALINVARTPGRTLVGMLALATGVAALTLLTAVTLAFRGVVIGSLLGDAVAVQVRGVDYIAVAATVALGVLAVADVLFLNIRERAAELATFRATGWPEHALSRLVVSEGILIGVAGSVTGAAAGLTGAALFAGTLPARLLAAAAAAVGAGILITAAAALLPAWLQRRLPTAHLLAEE